MKILKSVTKIESVEMDCSMMLYAIVEPAGKAIPEKVIALFNSESMASLFVEEANERYSKNYFKVMRIDNSVQTLP